MKDPCLCIFCGQSVDLVAGNWCGHGQMAHSECAESGRTLLGGAG